MPNVLAIDFVEMASNKNQIRDSELVKRQWTATVFYRQLYVILWPVTQRRALSVITSNNDT